MNDIDVILNALTKEREQLHLQLMQVDRIIKRVKTGTYSDEPDKPKEIKPATIEVKQINPIAGYDSVKIQILRIMDVIAKGCKLKVIQDEYTKLTGNKYNIRESMRALQTNGLIHLVKEKSNERGFMWIKRDWVENGRIKDEYKPDGFDLLYKTEDLLFK